MVHEPVMAWLGPLLILSGCNQSISSVQFSCSVMSDSLATPWTAACQAYLSITNSQNLLTLIMLAWEIPWLQEPGGLQSMGSPGEGNGNPLQYPCLENPMDRGAWQAVVHGVTRVRHDLATKPPPPLQRN
ncbi:hypothetical protein FD755_023435 [Muntiacus reevesi]|uniref:Uncharacterized protein n=1 Tax=Muntiacus reevesi TaxID=9886 RepID=A0A5N3VXS8_MUNRE|nr:hypothetical protein FD755_023435 [Muntiacus reevesi]